MWEGSGDSARNERKNSPNCVIASETSLFQSGWVKSNMATATATNRRHSPKNRHVFGLSVPTSPHLGSNRAQRGFWVHDFAIKGLTFDFPGLGPFYTGLLKGQSKCFNLALPFPGNGTCATVCGTFCDVIRTTENCMHRPHGRSLVDCFLRKLPFRIQEIKWKINSTMIVAKGEPKGTNGALTPMQGEWDRKQQEWE